MDVAQFIVAALMMFAQQVLTSPGARSQKRSCTMCPPGQYQKSCTQCAPCPVGTYTSEWNKESSCHHCFTDCRADFHLTVVKNCTRKSNLKCQCDSGFHCTDMDMNKENCLDCEKIRQIPATFTTGGPDVTHGPVNQTLPSSRHKSTSSIPCQHPRCGPQRTIPTDKPVDFSKVWSERELAAVLCPVAVGVVALLVLACVYCLRDEDCSKQGPVHIHNAGTVIFSLLSHFTGQVDQTREEEDEDDERYCPVFHPVSSPSILLSQEEECDEREDFFFPSQERGKDCHMSKEEAL